MKVFDTFAQYSENWWLTRKGLPSASGASRIITAGGKLSASHLGYIGELLSDELGFDSDDIQTEWMSRGLELEEEAVSMFEMRYDCTLETVGLILNDDCTACCSPDAMWPGEDGYYAGVEIKCPMPKTHIEYLSAGGLPSTYKQQVHMSLAVTGLDRWFFMSYHPELEPLFVLVERDEYTDTLETNLAIFVNKLNRTRKLING